jgi:hypothetical protein
MAKHLPKMLVGCTNVFLEKIEWPVWYIIYHHLPAVKGGFFKPKQNNQPMGKGHRLDVGG